VRIFEAKGKRCARDGLVARQAESRCTEVFEANAEGSLGLSHTMRRCGLRAHRMKRIAELSRNMERPNQPPSSPLRNSSIAFRSAGIEAASAVA